MRVATSAEASYGSSRLDSSRLCAGGVMGVGAGDVMGVGAGGVGVVIVAGVGGVGVGLGVVVDSFGAGLGVEATSTIASTFTSGFAGTTGNTSRNTGNTTQSREQKEETDYGVSSSASSTFFFSRSFRSLCATTARTASPSWRYSRQISWVAAVLTSGLLFPSPWSEIGRMCLPGDRICRGEAI